MSQRFIIIREIGKTSTEQVHEIDDQPFFLKVSRSGIQRLYPDEMCSVCDGSRGVRRFVAQDESVFAACPKCNGGTQSKWDSVKSGS